MRFAGISKAHDWILPQRYRSGFAVMVEVVAPADRPGFGDVGIQSTTIRNLISGILGFELDMPALGFFVYQ